jgi:Ca2+-binding RTX toxin-like protein
MTKLRTARRALPVFTLGDDRYTLNGYWAAYTVYMLAGNDYLQIHADSSFISAGLGNDVVKLYGAYTRVFMEDGNDQFYLTGGHSHFVDLGNGSDYANLIGHQNTISGGNGNDRIYVAGNANHIEGGIGDDFVNAHADWSVIKAGSGNDVVKLYGAYTRVSMEDGNDQFYLTGGHRHNVDLGRGADYASITGDLNIIKGGDGNDRIIVTGNSNYIEGNAGRDTFYVTGDKNTIVSSKYDVDDHTDQRSDFIDIKGDGNTIKTYQDRISIRHHDYRRKETTTILGHYNDIYVYTHAHNHAKPLTIITKPIEKTADSFYLNRYHLNMQEGATVSFESELYTKKINMRFGDAGRDNSFLPILLNLSGIKKTEREVLHINMYHQGITQAEGFMANQLAKWPSLNLFGFGNKKDASAPNGRILVPTDVPKLIISMNDVTLLKTFVTTV